MYIKLGSTKLNYLSQSTEDYVILSQIVDSSMGFEKPTIVRTIKQLDTWFGKEFKEYEYLKDLIDMGVTLYLYKPVDERFLNNIDDYIDLDNCKRYTDIESLDLITSPENNTIYTLISGEEYIYLSKYSEYILLENLPQNQITNNSVSLNNRDTLSIDENYYISPSYSEEDNSLISNSYKNYIPSDYTEERKVKLYNDFKTSTSNLTTTDYRRLKNGYKSFVFDLTFGDNFCILSENDRYQYFGIKDKLYVFSRYDISRDFLLTEAEQKIFSSTKFIILGNEKSNKDYFKDTLIEDDYLFDGDTLISKDLLTSIYYYNLKDFSIEPNYRKSCDLIYDEKSINEIISFSSKTIGTTGQIDGNINIDIKRLERMDEYQVTISRFDHFEVFEGTIDGDIYGQRLDLLISTNSELVYCNINNDRGYYKCIKEGSSLRWVRINENLLNSSDIKSLYTVYDIDYVYPGVNEGDIVKYQIRLPEGSWELCGAEYKMNTPKMFNRSLDIISNPSSPLYIDFILIPDIEKYINRESSYIDENTNSYKIYNKLLNLSKDIDCQVLIHNKPVKIETIEHEDGTVITGESEYNYLGDKDNRLIYFYDSIWVNGKEKPGYYIYLKYLLLNDTYSPEVSDIQYNTPVKNPYLGHFIGESDDEFKKQVELENWLKRRKTNYLVTNNQIYYYKDYQNGTSYNMTGWMRFCISKINRELIKNKWRIMETKNVGRIELNMRDILNKVKNSFSMIRDIQLSNFLISFKDSTIEATIDTYLSDLYNNHLSIDITFNYNKY